MSETFQTELNKPIEFQQVKNAFKIFADDYQIVNHPKTPVRTPFEKPNDLDHQGNRQYNLTLIPEDMTEKQFLNKLTGNLVISCMDKDAVGPVYDKVRKDFPDEAIVLLSMAGGIIQEHDKRKKALSTILRYISQHQEKITRVLATDHDHTCGYIKYTLKGKSLAEKIGVETAVPGNQSDPKEQQAMKMLIAQNIEDYNLKNFFGNKLMPALAVIDRKGSVKFDTDFHNIQPKKLDEI